MKGGREVVREGRRWEGEGDRSNHTALMPSIYGMELKTSSRWR